MFPTLIFSFLNENIVCHITKLPVRTHDDQGHQGLAVKGVKQSSHENGEIMPVWTYAARGLGPSRASCHRHKSTNS